MCYELCWFLMGVYKVLLVLVLILVVLVVTNTHERECDTFYFSLFLLFWQQADWFAVLSQWLKSRWIFDVASPAEGLVPDETGLTDLVPPDSVMTNLELVGVILMSSVRLAAVCTHTVYINTQAHKHTHTHTHSAHTHSIYIYTHIFQFPATIG